MSAAAPPRPNKTTGTWFTVSGADCQNTTVTHTVLTEIVIFPVFKYFLNIFFKLKFLILNLCTEGKNYLDTVSWVFWNINLKIHFFFITEAAGIQTIHCFSATLTVIFHRQYPCFARGEVRKSKWFYAQIHDKKKLQSKLWPCWNILRNTSSKQVMTMLKHSEKNIFKAISMNTLRTTLNPTLYSISLHSAKHLALVKPLSSWGHLAENILLYGSLEISQKQMKNKSRKHIPLFWQWYNKDRMRNTCLLTWFKGSGCMAKYVKVTGYERSTYQVLDWRKICISNVVTRLDTR